MILAIDPGKDKTGIALYNPETRKVELFKNVQTADFLSQLELFNQKYNLSLIVLGNGTYSDRFVPMICGIIPECRLEKIDEAYSTLEARKLYFNLYPPKGLKKLIPRSLLYPKEPIDHIVAIILLKRYLGKMPEIIK